MTDKVLRDGWRLLVRVEIDKSRRVQCQCRGCGKTVYADVHIIQWPDGDIACWGSRCFAREMGVAGRNLTAVYSRVNGRKLTDEERDLLDANRAALLALLKGVEAEIVQAEKLRERKLTIAGNIKAKQVGLPEFPPKDVQKPLSPSQPINYNERAHRYTIIFRNQDGEILKQLFRGDEQFCRSFIDRELENYPVGTEGQVTVTRTGKSIYRRRRI